MKKKQCFLFILFLFVSFTYAKEYAPLLVQDKDDVEYFIDRMVSRGILEVNHNNVKPWTRSDVVGFLLKISHKDGNNISLLNKTEKEQLVVLLKRFGLLKKTNSPQDGLSNYSSLFKWKDSGGSSFNINTLFFATTEFDDSLNSYGYVVSPGYGLRILGRYRKTVGFFVQDSLVGDYSNQERFRYNFNPNFGQFTMTPPEARIDGVKTDEQSYERYRGWISANVNGINILAGIDSPKWGTAGLGLSGEAPPFAQVRLWTDLGIMRYTYFHGSLESAHDTSTISKVAYLQKYFVGQRIDINFSKRLNVAYYSTLIYGNRLPDLVYMVPVTPLFFGEHFRGDRDNVAMGWDLTYYLLNGLKLYSEVFVDDLLSVTKISDSYWGNKWSYSIGTVYYTDILKRMCSFGIEYKRIEPWVYTHRFGEISRYRHFGTCLGSSIGPDSDQFKAQTLLYVNKKIKLSAEFENIRKGASLNGGSNITDTIPLIGETKEFLSGVVENRIYFKTGVNYRISESLFCDVLYRYSDIDNWDNIKNNSHCENRFYIKFKFDW